LDHAAVKHCNDTFKKYSRDFMLVANALLERGDDE
jgi:phytoene/squalene synthetase